MAPEEQLTSPKLIRIHAPGARMAGLVVSGSVLFVSLSLLAAALGPDGGADRRAAGASPSATTPGAGRAGPVDIPSRSPRPKGWPRLTVFGAAPAPPAVLVRSAGRQLVDLSTGRFGPVLDAGSWLDRYVQLGDGRLVCLCRSVSRGPAGMDRVSLVARILDLDGTTIRELPAGELLARHHRLAGDDPEGFGLQTAATLSRDGRSLVVGRAALDDEGWRVGVDVVDLTGAQPLRSAEFGTLPVPVPSRPDHMFAPRPELSPAGDAVVLRTDLPCCGNDARARTWSARIGPTGLMNAREWPETAAPAGVSCGIGTVAAADLYTALCYDSGDLPLLARFSLDGTLLGQTALPISGGPTELAIDPVRPRVYLWSAAARTLSVVDLADGRLRTTVTVPLGYETSRGLDLGRMLSGWLAPTTAAKVLIEPALALSADGSRLYAIGLDASEGGAAPKTAGIFVFDTATRDLVARWTVEGDVNSIRLSPDGGMLYAATMPIQGTDGNLEREATIVGLDAQTGRLRLVAGRLGAQPLLFLPPS